MVLGLFSLKLFNTLASLLLSLNILLYLPTENTFIFFMDEIFIIIGLIVLNGIFSMSEVARWH